MCENSNRDEIHVNGRNPQIEDYLFCLYQVTRKPSKTSKIALKGVLYIGAGGKICPVDFEKMVLGILIDT